MLHKIPIRSDLWVSFIFHSHNKINVETIDKTSNLTFYSFFLSENNCTWEDFDDKCFAAADENEEENENIDEDEDEETDDNDTNIEVIFK